MLHVAEPLVIATAPQPDIDTDPTSKFTVPIAVLGVIEAVKVTELPEAEGFADELTAVVDEVTTVWVRDPVWLL